MSQVGDSQGAAAGRNPLLGEAGGALGRRGERGQTGDVVGVGDMLADGLGVQGAILAEVEDVERARVGAEQEGLGRESVEDGWGVALAAGAVDGGEADLGDDDASLGGEVLNNRVGTG